MTLSITSCQPTMCSGKRMLILEDVFCLNNFCVIWFCSNYALLCSFYEMVTQHMQTFCWKLFPHTLHISASFSPWEGKLVKLLNLRNLPPQMLLPEFQTEWWSCFVIWFSLLTSCVWKFPSLYLVETCYECDCQYYFMS